MNWHIFYTQGLLRNFGGAIKMELMWVKCQGDVWCTLNSVNLDHEHFRNKQGVYIIWHGGQTPKVVYVGQGNIKERIAKHRKDQRIQQYQHLNLYVTWATVGEASLDGVEGYLADVWRPLVGENHPTGHINVNSPWG